MGLDYSIKLYFPTIRLRDVFTALTEFAEPRPEKTVSVHLPDSSQVVLPFTSGFRCEPVTLRLGGGSGQFDTSLGFVCDDAIREESYGHRNEIVNGVEVTYIGYIYLTVHVGCFYSEFSFAAATSGMSRLFVNSASIRNRFLQLLNDVGGVASWLDQETFVYHTLDDPQLTFQPDWVTAPTDGWGKRDSTSRDVVGLCRGLGRPVPEVSAIVACQTESAVGLARVIRDRQAFDLFPILADALEDAGCESRHVLDHLRKGDPHENGCWVADLLLGDGQ